MPNLHRLRVLDLIDCDLIEASACCAALSTALMTRNAPPLTQLALNYNRIGDEGLQILHRSLRWVLARGLTTLSMSFCELGSASGAILSSLLCGTRSSIRRLNLEGNHLGDAGLDQLSAGLECSTTVTGLILSANRIAAPFHGLRRFCDAVRGCGSLRLIDLDGNPLDDDAVQSVLNMIRTSAHLHDVRLWPGTTPALYQSVQTALLKNREIGAPAAASSRSVRAKSAKALENRRQRVIEQFLDAQHERRRSQRT